MGTLYLLPSLMGETDVKDVLPEKNIHIISELKYFIVEDIRTARRFLKRVDQFINIDELTFYILNEHTSFKDIPAFIEPLKKGMDVGLMSDAGCPGVADPGSDIVAIAHAEGVKVVPLVGPSSILMAMMASGLNGQNFAFVGYLPVKPKEKQQRLKELERRIMQENQSQLFIEAPYRNMKLLDDLIQFCNSTLKLTIACDITTQDEFIVTKPVQAWKTQKPDLHKRPTIFILGK